MANSSNFGGVLFPMVKRVFATTIASQLVPVQPMSPPIGVIPIIQPTYGVSYLLHEKQKEFLQWLLSSPHLVLIYEVSEIITNERYTDENRKYLNSLLIMYEHEYIKSKIKNKI